MPFIAAVWKGPHTMPRKQVVEIHMPRNEMSAIFLRKLPSRPTNRRPANCQAHLLTADEPFAEANC
jgi:hypothetical protein